MAITITAPIMIRITAVIRSPMADQIDHHADRDHRAI